MLRVRLLDGLAVETESGDVPVPPGRCAGLLAWLALHPGMQPRAHVAARLWPDVLDESARQSLRGALLDLRRALGPEAGRHLLATRDAIGLGPDDEVAVDVRDLAAALAEGRTADAVALGVGVLLPDVEQEWVHAARTDHEQRVAEALDTLAAEAEGRGDLGAAVGHSRRLVGRDPLSEEHARGLIRRLAAAGDVAAALTAFAEHRERLRSELQLAPSAATRALVDGLRSPLPAEPAARGGGVLPAPLAAVADGPPLVGREAELDALQSAWDEVAGGVLRVCLVTGEAGIGKSRVVAELARRVVDGGGHVLYGACADDLRPPYGPFVDAITLDLRDVSDAEARARTGAAGEQLARVVPVVAERLAAPAPALTGASPEADQLRLFAAVGDYLHRAARPRVLLVLEDIHWAASATLALLGHIVRAGRGGVLIAVTSRDVAPDLTDALSVALSDLQRLEAVRRIPLVGLSPDDVETLLRAREERAVMDVERLAGRLHELTGGSPLFLRELVRDLGEDGSPALAAGPTLRDHVAARFARLPPADAELLDVAAVLGAAFAAGVLARVLERPLGDVLDALDRAAASGVVAAQQDAPGRFGFAHAVLREVRYAALPAGRRMRIHQAAGLVLREAGAPVEELARHFCAAAELGDPREAFRYAREAGRRARERFAFADAAGYLEQAERVGALLPGFDDAVHCELLIARGEALHRAGDPRHHEVLMQAADLATGLGDGALLTRTALALSEQGWAISIGTRDQDVVRVARQALVTLPPEAGAARARLLASIAAATYLSDGFDEAVAVAVEALEVARAADDPSALGEVLVATHIVCYDPETAEHRLAWAAEVLALAETQDDPVLLTHALWLCGHHRLEHGELDAARPLFARADRIADELDVAYLRVFGQATAAIIAVLDGRLEVAGRLVGDCLALSRRIGMDGSAFFGGVAGAVAIEHGLWEQGVATVGPLVERAPGMTAYRAALAMFHARVGDLDAARRIVAAFLESDFAILPRNIQWAPAMIMLADAVAWTSDAEAAAHLRTQLEPVAGRTAWAAYTALPPVDVALAQLAVVGGDHAGAARHLDDAAAICERCDLPLHRIRVALHRARAARQAGTTVDGDLPATIAAARAAPGAGLLREARLMGLIRA